MKSCVVIGGGVIGLCSAYYLAKAGHEVTVIDRSDMSDGCSYGNAGMIVPSHVIPLAQPGMISQGIKWMFNSKSPFYVRPRLNRALMSWGWSFYKSASQEHVNRSMPALLNLSLLSKELYRGFEGVDRFQYEEKGLLMLYKTPKVEEEEKEAAEAARKLGLQVDVLNREQVSGLESGIQLDVSGGIHYKSDAHLSPQRFMEFLKNELISVGVKFKKNCTISGVQTSNTHVKYLETSEGMIEGDEYILSAGVWSTELAKQLGLKIKMLPGKGYSFIPSSLENRPGIPSILCEGKVAVTPMNGKVRFGGTMEITHTKDHRINLNRVEGIVNTVNQFYPEMNLSIPNKEEVWHGFRPCTPTGLPVISRSNKWNNLVIATGHAMMGLSLAPATGKIVEEIVGNKKPSVEISLFKG